MDKSIMPTTPEPRHNTDCWRLATKYELLFICNDIKEKGEDSVYFKYFNTKVYWSSTTSVNDTDNAWYVYFGDCNDGKDDKKAKLYVRLIRGNSNDGFEIYEEEKFLKWKGAAKWVKKLNDAQSLYREEEDCVVSEPLHNTDGGKTSYYDIKGCEDLDDLAEHLKLTPAEFNCMKAIFGIAIERSTEVPRHDGGDSLRDARKLNHYAARIKRTAEREKEEKNRKKR